MSYAICATYSEVICPPGTQNNTKANELVASVIAGSSWCYEHMMDSAVSGFPNGMFDDLNDKYP